MNAPYTFQEICEGTLSVIRALPTEVPAEGMENDSE